MLELGEQFEEGVRREVAEETGMTVDVDRLTGVYKNRTIAIPYRPPSMSASPWLSPSRR